MDLIKQLSNLADSWSHRHATSLESTDNLLYCREELLRLIRIAKNEPSRVDGDFMPNAVKRDWVTCPICESTDMRREEDEDGNALILCVNHACASNGGSNREGLNKRRRPICKR